MTFRFSHKILQLFLNITGFYYRAHCSSHWFVSFSSYLIFLFSSLISLSFLPSFLLLFLCFSFFPSSLFLSSRGYHSKNMPKFQEISRKWNLLGHQKIVFSWENNLKSLSVNKVSVFKYRKKYFFILSLSMSVMNDHPFVTHPLLSPATIQIMAENRHHFELDKTHNHANVPEKYSLI